MDTPAPHFHLRALTVLTCDHDHLLAGLHVCAGVSDGYTDELGGTRTRDRTLPLLPPCPASGVPARPQPRLNTTDLLWAMDSESHAGRHLGVDTAWRGVARPVGPLDGGGGGGTTHGTATGVVARYQAGQRSRHFFARDARRAVICPVQARRRAQRQRTCLAVTAIRLSAAVRAERFARFAVRLADPRAEIRDAPLCTSPDTAWRHADAAMPRGFKLRAHRASSGASSAPECPNLAPVAPAAPAGGAGRTPGQ